MRVRYYDAETAQYVTKEPIWPKIADPRQINQYQYALNEPVRYVDITGAEPFRAADLPLGFIIDWWSTQIDMLAQQGESARDFVGNSEVTGKKEIYDSLNMPLGISNCPGCTCMPPPDIEPKNGVPGTDPQDRQGRKPAPRDEIQDEIENQVAKETAETVGKRTVGPLAKKLAPHIPGIGIIVKGLVRKGCTLIEGAIAEGNLLKWAGQMAIDPDTARKEIHETLPSNVVALQNPEYWRDPNTGTCEYFVSCNVEFYGKITSGVCGDDTWSNIWD